MAPAGSPRDAGAADLLERCAAMKRELVPDVDKCVRRCVLECRSHNSWCHFASCIPQRFQVPRTCRGCRIAAGKSRGCDLGAAPAALEATEEPRKGRFCKYTLLLSAHY